MGVQRVHDALGYSMPEGMPAGSCNHNLNISKACFRQSLMKSNNSFDNKLHSSLEI